MDERGAALQDRPPLEHKQADTKRNPNKTYEDTPLVYLLINSLKIACARIHHFFYGTVTDLMKVGPLRAR